MLDNLINFFKKMNKKEEETELLPSSSDAAKERLHLVLMQDRVNVSVDFMDMMKGEIIDVIKKYIDIDEKEMDVRLTNQINEDGSNGVPALYANIPIVAIKNDKIRELNSEQSVENNTNISTDTIIKKAEVTDKEITEKKETVKKRVAKTGTTNTTRKVNKEEKDVENKVKTATKTTTKTRKTADKKESAS